MRDPRLKSMEIVDTLFSAMLSSGTGLDIKTMRSVGINLDEIDKDTLEQCLEYIEKKLMSVNEEAKTGATLLTANTFLGKKIPIEKKLQDKLFAHPMMTQWEGIIQKKQMAYHNLYTLFTNEIAKRHSYKPQS